jgi:hypothetical protein
MTAPALGPVELRGWVDGAPLCTLRINCVAKWLNSNDSGAWQRHHHLVALWRQMAGWAAVAAKAPRLSRAYILAELRFRDRRRRDPANWYPTVKAAVDGLVDIGVLPDDSADFLIGPDLRLGPVERTGNGCLLLHIWAVA